MYELQYNLPTLSCSYPTCNYATKIKYRYNRHIKIHTKEYQQKRKKEETKILH